MEAHKFSLSSSIICRIFLEQCALESFCFLSLWLSRSSFFIPFLFAINPWVPLSSFKGAGSEDLTPEGKSTLFLSEPSFIFPVSVFWSLLGIVLSEAPLQLPVTLPVLELLCVPRWNFRSPFGVNAIEFSYQ